MAEKLRELKELLKDPEVRNILRDLLYSYDNHDDTGKNYDVRPAEDREVGGSNPPRPNAGFILRILEEDLHRFKEWLDKNYPSRSNYKKSLFYAIRKMLREINYVYEKSKILWYIDNKILNKKTKSHYLIAIKYFEMFLRDYLKININFYDELKEKIGWHSSEPTDIFGLSKEDVIKGFRGLSKESHRVFYALLTVTGLRLGEARSIHIKDIDIDNRIIYLYKIRRTKRAYIVFITSEVKQMISDYLHKNNTEYPFKLSDRQIKQLFKQASANAGVKITAQRLRKFFATYSIENGMNPLVVDFLQGRVNYNILTKHYLRFDVRTLRREYDKVWERFKFEA